jgi:hypothetical protein
MFIGHFALGFGAKRWAPRQSLGVLIAAAALGSAMPVAAQETPYVYRSLLMRAAPGRLLDLIDLLNARMPVLDAAGEERPLILRHSQGDQWDLMLLYPIGGLGDYFGAQRERRRMRAAEAAGLSEADFERRLDELVAWREEEFVAGPALAALRGRDRGAGFYHVEMFVALAGRRGDLLRQRQMENAFLAGTGRPDNLIFTRIAGAAWDLFTIGFYRDLRHFAEDSPASATAQDSVARAAGFQGRSRIGTYLRELIAWHHDTLASRAHQ